MLGDGCAADRRVALSPSRAPSVPPANARPNPSRAFAGDHGIPLISVGGLPIAVIDRKDSARLMVEVALSRRGSGGPPPVITSANGQVISMCAREPELRDLFLSADLIHADGMPLVFASRLKCHMALPERVATTDLFHDVARIAETRGARFYLLGATGEVIERAARNVRQRYPRLAIAGVRSGYFTADEESRLVDDINAARPDILWVGMGAPIEQAFALRNRARLAHVGLIKTSGGLFDFLSGKSRRAPLWMQSAGLEWLYRTVLEPRRLLYRYLTTNPHAFYLLLTTPSRAASEEPETTRP
jgi:N-acetylglucosaminyldiphosphoundecaprenol N-acetyl-beta-D-mannosaminyltransferase